MIPIPKGYRYAATAAGFKYSGRNDLAAIVSERDAHVAGVFTKNAFTAAPVMQCKEQLAANLTTARAILVNAGQANACTGEAGLADCRLTLEWAEQELGVPAGSIYPCSTGVIGPRLPMDKFRSSLPVLADTLGHSSPLDVAKAIMTTDAFPKLAWGAVEVHGHEVRILGICKGAGMICPDMATMLGFILTDGGVEQGALQTALSRAVDASFNAVTVDGDTSTNDTVLALANNGSGVVVGSDAMDAFTEALTEVCQALAYMLVQDGEGATKVVSITVRRAASEADAKLAARTIAHSPLVKTAMFGCDANWGRIVAALGRSGAQFNPDHVTVRIGNVAIFERGVPVHEDFDSLLAPHMQGRDIRIEVDLDEGGAYATVLASDLGHEYVNINADYRS